jgi:thiamine kinase-like enzyme
MLQLSAKSAFQYLYNFPSPVMKLYDFAPLIKLDDIDIERSNIIIQEFFGSSRNCIFKIKFGTDRDGFILKQPNNLDKNFVQTIVNEASFYYFIKSIYPDYYDFGSFQHFDKDNNILVFKTDSTFSDSTIQMLIENEDMDIFIEGLANHMYQYHEVFLNNAIITNHLPVYKTPLLQEFMFQRILAEMDSFENRNLRLISNKLKINEASINAIAINFREGETLIHRDVRYSNVLINKSQNSAKLIDWEMAAVGDRYWDLADFCFHLLRYTVYDGNNRLDPGIDTGNLFNYVIKFMDKYYELIFSNDNSFKKSDFCKKVLQLFFIRMIENYRVGVLNNFWSDTNNLAEYRVIEFFWDLIEHENIEDDAYFTNYLKNKKGII